MAGENEALNEQNESQEDESKVQGFLRSGVAGLIIRILGWMVAILVGVGLMFLTAYAVDLFKDDDPADKSIVDPREFTKPPIYSVHPLDTFTITLDKTDDDEKTTMVTAELVLAYPPDSKEIGSELNQRNEQLSDVLQSIIAQKNFEDINTADERENELKLELIEAVNRNLINKGIVDIFITQFEISRF
jgi:flagellar basal body-associated protein FliL